MFHPVLVIGKPEMLELLDFCVGAALFHADRGCGLRLNLLSLPPPPPLHTLTSFLPFSLVPHLDQKAHAYAWERVPIAVPSHRVIITLPSSTRAHIYSTLFCAGVSHALGQSRHVMTMTLSRS